MFPIVTGYSKWSIILLPDAEKCYLNCNNIILQTPNYNKFERNFAKLAFWGEELYSLKMPHSIIE